MRHANEENFSGIMRKIDWSNEESERSREESERKSRLVSDSSRSASSIGRRFNLSIIFRDINNFNLNKPIQLNETYISNQFL